MVLGVALVLTACDETAPVFDKPHIVVVLVDTLRADHTSVHGYERDTTPWLAHLARDGLVLENHFANAPWTKPSVASILTGLHPSAHGSRRGQFEDLDPGTGRPTSPVVEVLSDGLDTLPERLGRTGYRTLAFVNNRHMLDRFGYHQGYDEYHFSTTRGRRAVRSDADAVNATIDALARADGPTFVWCHMMSVHDYVYPDSTQAFPTVGTTPLDPEAPLFHVVDRFGTLESVVAHYDNAVVYTDLLLGRLVRYVREHNPHTILVITSDHGEEFYEHGGFQHVRTLYDELLRVPLVVWGPGVPSGRVNGLTDSLDVLPTLLSAAGLPPDGSLPGQDLLASPVSEVGKADVYAEKHHAGLHERFALVRPDAKLILSRHRHRGTESIELYRSPTPGTPVDEQHDVAGRADPGELAGLRAALEQHQARADAVFERLVGDSELQTLDEADLEALRAMGYVDDG